MKLFFAWCVAVVGVLSTLFLSNILNWPVCVLCWYQRIALYPLVVLLGIAAYKGDKYIIPYTQPFCIIGFIIALYQYCEQMIPGFMPIQTCTTEVPCDVIHMKLLGFITLPFLSALGFALIFFVITQRCGRNY